MWADIYSQQLKSGQEYLQLRPTYSIWLLAENLLVDDNAYVHHYKMRDEQGLTLTPHGGIWLLELKKFNANQVETEDQRWLKFFKDGERLHIRANILSTTIENDPCRILPLWLAARLIPLRQTVDLII